MNQGKNPEISVIMSIYNQKDQNRLEKAIMSILRQTFTDFEFIIYDDGSDPEIASYLEKYQKLDKRIVLISNPVNHGLAYSLNSCIDVAKGKYLARMDDDDISLSNRLQLQYDYLESHPEVAFLGCNAKLLDENGIWGIRRMPEYPSKKDFLRFSPFIHPTVLIRREVFENEAAYCDAKENLRCEDYELFMRLSSAGYIGVNLQQECFLYREDRNSYAKRRLRYRLDEFHLRIRNFKQAGMLFPFGWIYALRPLAAAVIPDYMIWRIKRFHHRQDFGYERYFFEEKKTLSEDFEKSPTIV